MWMLFSDLLKTFLIVSTYFIDFQKLNTKGKINTSSTKIIFNRIQKKKNINTQSNHLL